MCCFHATERLRRPRCSYKQGLNYPFLPTRSYFYTAHPDSYPMCTERKWNLHISIGARSPECSERYLHISCMPWRHDALCINKAFIRNKVKYQGRHTVNNYRFKFNLTDASCINNLITADYNSLSSDVNIYHEFRTNLLYKTVLPFRFQETNTCTLHEGCINLARRVPEATTFFTVDQGRRGAGRMVVPPRGSKIKGAAQWMFQITIFNFLRSTNFKLFRLGKET